MAQTIDDDAVGPAIDDYRRRVSNVRHIWLPHNFVRPPISECVQSSSMHNCRAILGQLDCPGNQD